MPVSDSLPILLPRRLIAIEGEEARPFLQGIITNHVDSVTEKAAIYTLLLNPQGRFLYDFFVLEYKGGLLLDVAADQAEALVKRLNLYKLRRQVTIALSHENWQVWASPPEHETDISAALVVEDPRTAKMGLRCYGVPSAGDMTADLSGYNHHRIALGLADASDMTPDKSFPMQFGLQHFNAIHFEKGCYVGQEVTARMHFKGELKKGIYRLKTTDGQPFPPKGSAVTAQSKKLGECCSSVGDVGLALLRHDAVDGGSVLEVDGVKLVLVQDA